MCQSYLNTIVILIPLIPLDVRVPTDDIIGLRLAFPCCFFFRRPAATPPSQLAAAYQPTHSQPHTAAAHRTASSSRSRPPGLPADPSTGVAARLQLPPFALPPPPCPLSQGDVSAGRRRRRRSVALHGPPPAAAASICNMSDAIPITHHAHAWEFAVDADQVDYAQMMQMQMARKISGQMFQSPVAAPGATAPAHGHSLPMWTAASDMQHAMAMHMQHAQHSAATVQHEAPPLFVPNHTQAQTGGALAAFGFDAPNPIRFGSQR